MRNVHSILLCGALGGVLSICPAIRAADPPASQPADLKTAADERHKHLDERWRQFNDSLRTNQRTRYADTPILRTFQPGTLLNLSLVDGMLVIEPTDLATPLPARVAVEGSKAIWILSRPSATAFNPARAPLGRPYFTLSRFDFDAKEEQPWQSRVLLSDQRISLLTQNTYNNTSLIQTPGSVKVRVAEYGQMGQVPNVIYAGQAASLVALRAAQPEEFRLYVVPLLAQFTDASFLQPGPADIYSAFVEIPADQNMTHNLDQIIPELDADDPAAA